MSSSPPLQITRLVQAPAAEAFRAFTHETALRDWLCSRATCQVRLDGPLFLWWENGRIVTGKFTRFEPGKALTFTWQGQGEPGRLEMAVSFEEKDGSTLVALVVSGLAEDDQQRPNFSAAWDANLENLQSFLETGIDLRVVRRPRMGIFINDFTPKVAAELGVPVNEGIYLGGTAEGSGAHAAGLQKDDVLVNMDGKPLTDYPSIGLALEGHHAGDKLPVEYYRHSQKLTTTLELGRFPIPEYPTTASALADAVAEKLARMRAEFAELVAGLTDEQAAHPPAEGEWSVKEIIAHFILMERDFQSWMADMLKDTPIEDYLEERPNVIERLRPVTKRFGSQAALFEELALTHAESIDLIAGLPEKFVQQRKHLYRRAASWELENCPIHFTEEHKPQIQATIAAARQAFPG